jgi:hypothetical protein
MSETQDRPQTTTPPLERDLLIAEARRRARLEDLGDTWFFEPLDKLLAVEKAEAQLSERGAALEAERIVGYLMNRLTRVGLIKKHPEILDEDVKVAAAIISLGRTGSTKTHRMLGAAPDHTTMKWWEAQFPYPLADEEPGKPVERRARAKAIHDLWPDMSHIHPSGLDQPEEEAMVIDQSFVGTMIECFLWVPGFTEWQKGYDQAPGYEELKVALQILQWQDPSRRGKRWILKSPTHMSAPKALLDAFPGSLMIQTHRNPLKTVPSHCSMITPLIQMKTDKISKEQIGRFTCARWAGMANDVIDLRQTIGDDRFIDVQFETLTERPVEVAREIFDRMETPMTEADEAAIGQWLVDNKREKWSPHIYDFETYGLSEEIIKSDFARYIARHCA